MAIIGTHTLIYTSEPEACRAALRNVFGFDHVDDGDGDGDGIVTHLLLPGAVRVQLYQPRHSLAIE